MRYKITKNKPTIIFITGRYALFNPDKGKRQNITEIKVIKPIPVWLFLILLIPDSPGSNLFAQTKYPQYRGEVVITKLINSIH